MGASFDRHSNAFCVAIHPMTASQVRLERSYLLGHSVGRKAEVMGKSRMMTVSIPFTVVHFRFTSLAIQRHPREHRESVSRLQYRQKRQIQIAICHFQSNYILFRIMTDRSDIRPVRNDCDIFSRDRFYTPSFVCG